MESLQERYRSDNQVNHRVSYVVRNGRLVEEKWMNVRVGDVIRMENNQFVAVRFFGLLISVPLYATAAPLTSAFKKKKHRSNNPITFLD